MNGLFALLFLAGAQPAQVARAPEPPAPRVVVVGHGNDSCARWTIKNSDDALARTVYQAWLEGFLTGMNLSNYRTLGNLTEGTDVDRMTAWVDNYCAANPTANVGAAAEALAVAIRAHGKHKGGDIR